MIYALVHPDTLEIRYVGKTGVGVSERFREHRKNARRGAQNPVYRWWRKCESEPVAISLGAGDSVEEIQWIADLRQQGARLLNCTDGGDGCRVTPETKAKQSDSARTSWKVVRANKRHGTKHSPEARLKMSIATKGKPRSIGACLYSGASRKDIRKNARRACQ
jgi:hypothetical protein